MYPAEIGEALIRISAPPLGSQTPRSDRSLSPKNIVAARELLRAVPNPLSVLAKPVDALSERISASLMPAVLLPGRDDAIPERIGVFPDFINPSPDSFGGSAQYLRASH